MYLSRFSKVTLFFGYGFLYIPILYLVVFSFNKSKILGAWTGFTTKWYEELFNDPDMAYAFFNSLHIAVITATLAVILGTIAAVIMVRHKNFKGKTLFGGLISAPLIMPDVVTGLSLLLMFVSLEKLIGWPSQRGMLTVIIAHTTLAMAYVYLVVQARLKDMDHTLEEAAMDLGAKPTTVFFKITLPIISPALISGWLLAFALSLDDVVIASFLSGPGSTTLPILVFSSVRTGLNPELNALAAVIIGVISMGIIIAAFYIGFKKSLVIKG